MRAYLKAVHGDAKTMVSLIAIEYFPQVFPADGLKIWRLVFVVHRHRHAQVGITRMEIIPAEISRMKIPG